MDWPGAPRSFGPFSRLLFAGDSCRQSTWSSIEARGFPPSPRPHHVTMFPQFAADHYHAASLAFSGPEWMELGVQRWGARFGLAWFYPDGAPPSQVRTLVHELAHVILSHGVPRRLALARLLAAELGAPEDKALALLVLDRLALLEDNRLPEGAEKVTRRAVARRLALRVLPMVGLTGAP